MLKIYSINLAKIPEFYEIHSFKHMVGVETSVSPPSPLHYHYSKEKAEKLLLQLSDITFS